MTPRTILGAWLAVTMTVACGPAATSQTTAPAPTPAPAAEVAPAAPPLAAQAAAPVAPPLAPPVAPSVAAAPEAAHAAFSALLVGTVVAGVVDYAALKRQESRLDGYLAQLEATDPAALDSAARKAFWINAYNACTLKLMLERFPGIASIKDIPAGQRWDAERWIVHGRPHSLDEMEHRILRPMGDPRIHFAIVCASRSCPDLAARAYEAATLDEQLDAAARGFLANTRKGLRFGTEKGLLYGENQRLQLSAIFDWFAEDFVKRSGSVVDFVLPFAPPDAAEFIRAHRADLPVAFLDYDWSLNDR